MALLKILKITKHDLNFNKQLSMLKELSMENHQLIDKILSIKKLQIYNKQQKISTTSQIKMLI
ncbi:hypothetical protein C0075_26055 [Rhizobium sp. KAs_5_22]|nr:hypothetical protein C0075_26055 [Rhizobium sp. KAs_5_22]